MLRFARGVLVLVVTGCGGSTTTGSTPDGDAGPADVDGPVLDQYGCDPIVPTFCGVPFPSNVYLVPDPAMVTGFHVEVPQKVVPASRDGVLTDTSIFRGSDGFSPGAELLVHLPGATITGLADPEHIEDSLLPSSPTVILDATTGARVPHWAELDMRSQPDPEPAHDTPARPRLLAIRPAFRLDDARRYIVAVRDVVDVDGAAIPPSDVFKALRDREPSMLGTVGGRRRVYEDMFAKLATAGIERSTLQIAWDFTTASSENNTRFLVHMRDTALASLPAGMAPAYTITSVVENPSADIARRIEGLITVPMFLDRTTPGGRMSFDAAGLPVQQGTAEFPFALAIPHSASSGPRPLLHVGHGLFGGRDVVDDSRITPLAQGQGVVLLALDWLGLSSDDLPELGTRLASGDLSAFATVPERGMQAMVNNLMADRLVLHGLADDERTFLDGQTRTIDPSQLWYWGASLGGIYGATFMSLTTDIPRGVLGVPGQSFNLMLPRSIHYDAFLLFMRDTYTDPSVYPLFLSYAAIMWDRVEPTGFSKHIVDDPLPGTPSHQVLLIDALRDRQVSTYASHVMARAIGVPQVGKVRDIFGIPEAASPRQGSALVEVDFGVPPSPLINVPPDDSHPDTHDSPWGVPIVVEMMSRFLLTGEVRNDCSGGVCNPD